MKHGLKTSRYITGFDGYPYISRDRRYLISFITYSNARRVFRRVPVFFVVSGYLITAICFGQEWDQNGRIAVKDFYVRRMKTTVSWHGVMLLLSAAYITLFQRNLLNNLRGSRRQQSLVCQQWWQINHGLSYFDRFGNESPFTHLWSLAVEGQNYLIWPLLFMLLMKLVKNRGTIFKIVIGCSLLSALLLAIWYSPGAGPPTRVYYGTDTRLFSIWMGSALGFHLAQHPFKKEIPKKAKRVLNLAGGLSFIGLVINIFLC